jgi:hypothetical protein
MIHDSSHVGDKTAAHACPESTSSFQDASENVKNG